MKTAGAGLCLLAASTFAPLSGDQSNPVENGYSLRGKVVDGVSGRPIRDVELRLLDLRWQAAAEPTTPDSQGLFVFSGLTTGEYILSADGPEFGQVFFDELPEPWLVQTIHIKPEDQETVVLFRIVPRIAIGGTVRDEFGDPVERIYVTVHRPVWEEGRVVLKMAQQTQTDDRGRYRVGRLQPGGYVVCANVDRHGSGASLAPIAGPVDFASRRAPRVYMQTCNPSASPADVLQVRAGRQAEVNLTLDTSAAVLVRGRLVNLPQGLVAQVRLVRESQFGRDQAHVTIFNQDGTFAFRGVASGHYRLEADVNTQEPDGKGRFLTARLPLDIGGANLEAVEAPLEAGGVIDVVLQGPGGEKIAPERVQVGLRPDVGDYEMVQWAQPDPKAGIRFPGLPAGSYWLVTRTDTNTNKSICLESAKLGEYNALNVPLTVTPGMTARLDVMLSKTCGKIKARAVRDGNPVAGAKVVLLLSGSAKQPHDLLKDYADEHGETSFAGLAPGRYRLWAWSVDGFGAFVGPAKLDGAGDQSVIVPVASGEQVSIDVPLLRQEDERR